MWFSKKNNSEQKAPSTSGLAVSQELLKGGKWSSDFILSGIQDGVVMVGQDKLIHLFNPAASQVTGWPPDQAIGLEYHSVIALVDEHGMPYPPENHPFARVLKTGQPLRDSKGWLATQGGKRIPVSINVSPLQINGQSSSDTVVGILRDITKEKDEEKQRSDFISTASHEMRTPVAAIEGYLSLALNPKVAQIDDSARKYLEKAVNSTQHLGKLFQDLLTSSRAEDGRLTSFPKVIELGELVEQVAEAGRFNAKKKNLDLRFVISSDTGGVSGEKVLSPQYYVNVDPGRISEVLQNIIDNAIKYTADGEIIVRLTGDASIVQIQVQDSGPGIPAEDIPHLFQKFYRVDSSLTRTVGGTGLGLYIARMIVEMYQGRIWVESQLGKGSTFFINLPRLNTEQALAIQKQQAANFSPLDEH